MGLPAEKARYTFANCLTWEEKERIEIIEPVPAGGWVYL